MRLTTTKILLATCPVSPDSTWLVPIDKLRILTPGLTVRGFESLIFLLKTRQWLTSSVLTDGTYVQLTQLGIEAISGQFPALLKPTNTQPTDWYLVLFSRPPAGDPSFRYLRRLVLQHGAVQLTRGQYMFSLAIPGDVNLVLKRLYSDSVYVCRVSEWLAGYISPRILSQNQTAELITISSGLSKQMDRLLVKFNRNKRLTVNDKKTIVGLYDQLIFILKNNQFISQLNSDLVITPIQLLVKLQQVTLL